MKPMPATGSKRSSDTRIRLLPGAALLLLALSLLALLLAPGAPFAPSARAQDEGPTERGSRTFQETVEVSWVLVPVVVRSRGGYVGELTKEDFRLRVDGEAVPIETFDASRDAATSLAWLQDLSGSMANGDKLEASQRAFLWFLERLRPGDEMAVATFAGGMVQVEVPFTSNLEALEEAVGTWHGWGTTSLHDAVAFVPDITEAGRHRKRGVILVTDGVDNASVLEPVEARLIVREARLPVYVLGFTTWDPRRLPPAGGGEEDGFRYAQLLRRLARASGGRFFQVEDPDEIETAAAAVMDEIRHQYLLGFPARTGPRRYREIEVELVDRKKAELLHRQGYYGGLPAPGAG